MCVHFHSVKTTFFFEILYIGAQPTASCTPHVPVTGCCLFVLQEHKEKHNVNPGWHTLLKNL